MGDPTHRYSPRNDLIDQGVQDETSVAAVQEERCHSKERAMAMSGW